MNTTAALSPFTSFVVLGFVVAIGLFILACGLNRSRHPQVAAAAQVPPAPVQPRALPDSDVRLCATRGHITAPWATTEHFQPVCTRCGHVIERRAPFDRVVAEVAELERIWEAS